MGDKDDFDLEFCREVQKQGILGRMGVVELLRI